MKLQANFLLFSLLPLFATASFKIAGGSNIRITDAPFSVSLLKPSTLGFHCTGVIVHPKFILTAAHCFFEKPHNGFGRYVYQAQLFVRAGSEFWNRGGVVYSTTDVALAPRWSTDFLYFDLAIARLNDTLRFSEKINKISLPAYRAPVPPNAIGLAVGYGITYDGSTTPAEKLQAVELPVWTYQDCDNFFKRKAPKQYSPLVGKGSFCAGFKNQNKTICLGDSGGAFVIRKVLYGIISFGSNCGEMAPSYFVEVSQFEEMIDNFIKEHDLI